jgi:hypothetical protein
MVTMQYKFLDTIRILLITPSYICVSELQFSNARVIPAFKVTY